MVDSSRLRVPPWALLTLVCTGQFMVILDVSIVNVALPAIRSDLGFSEDSLHWVVNSYALTFAGFLLLGGRAADLYGRKRIFLLGLAIFAGASLVGGLAPNAEVLIAARTVQGLGAAVLAPATLTILTTTFTEGPARVRAIALWSAMGAIGGASGAVLGGVLTEALSWRWILLINAPVGAVVILCALRWLDELRGQLTRRLDLTGAVLVTLGLTAIAYGVVQTHEEGWAAVQTVGMLGAGVVLIGAFVLVQGRFAADPLMPLRVWRSRTVAGTSLVVMLTGGVAFSMWYFLSLYMQNVLGYSAIETGLSFLPHTATLVLTARATEYLLPRFGPRALIIAGAVISAVGFVWQAQLDASGSFVSDVLLPGLVMCLGIGLTFAPLVNLATSAAEPGDEGLASGLLNTSRTVGGSIALAALATAATSRTDTSLGDGTRDVQALTDGYALAFGISAVVLGVAAVLAVVMISAAPRRRVEPAVTAGEQQPAPAA